MRAVPRLALLLTSLTLPSLCAEEKKTDQRLIYRSENIIRQQDAEEGRFSNGSEPTRPGPDAESVRQAEGEGSENAIAYLPHPKKVPKFDEIDVGYPGEPVVVHVPEGMPELCSLPKRTGKCRGRMPRFYFNMATKECERFVYGGCDGNANRFLTLAECDETCQPSVY